MIKTDKDTMQWLGQYFEEKYYVITGRNRPFWTAAAVLEKIEEWWLENKEPYRFSVSSQDWNAIKHYLEIAAVEGDTEAEEILEDCFED